MEAAKAALMPVSDNVESLRNSFVCQSSSKAKQVSFPFMKRHRC
jgi:hypothetical protein